jgi:hypothetical protein
MEEDAVGQTTVIIPVFRTVSRTPPEVGVGYLR